MVLVSCFSSAASTSSVDSLAAVAEFGGDPGNAVGAARFVVHGSYPDGEVGVGRLPGGPVRGRPAPVVEAGAGDAQDRAQPLHAVAAVVVGDELEAVHQRVSPAKYSAALRRISRSSSSSRTFWRRAAFSASSGVGGSAGASARRPRGRLAPAARTQFRKVSGLIPRSAATLPDRRLGPRLVQRDRVRLELRRTVLHGHEMSVPQILRIQCFVCPRSRVKARRRLAPAGRVGAHPGHRSHAGLGAERHHPAGAHPDGYPDPGAARWPPRRS